MTSTESFRNHFRMVSLSGIPPIFISSISTTLRAGPNIPLSSLTSRDSSDAVLFLELVNPTAL